MKKIILIYILIFSVIGCTSTTPISTLAVNTSTSIPATASPTVTLESSKDVCKKVEQVDLLEVESQGKMIFTTLHYEGYIVNTNNFEKIKIDSEEDVLFSIAISPNRQLTAYELYSRNSDDFTLVVTRFEGIPEITIPWEEDWGGIVSWLDNQNLLISLTVELTDQDISAKEFSTFLVFNPFTGERKILEPNFPEIYSHHMFATWDEFGSTVYDSSLNLVVYPKDNITSSDTFSHVTLWAIDKQEILADFKIFLTNKTTPVWSPDGEKFAVALVTYEESLKNDNWPIFSLYNVTRFGEVEKITDLSDYFPYYYIGEHTWSPDGKYIAFWLSGWFEHPKDPEDSYLKADQYLAIVEVENKKLKIYCIAGYSFRRFQVEPPIWSPDGLQILIESPLSNEHSQVLLLDLEKEVVAKIGEDMIPVGWMVEP